MGQQWEHIEILQKMITNAEAMGTHHRQVQEWKRELRHRRRKMNEGCTPLTDMRFE